MILKSILIWLLIIPFAILNGVLRESVLNSILGENVALPISGILLSLIIFLIAYFLLPKLKLNNVKVPCYIGLLWMTLTIVFEFGIDALSGQDFQEMLLAYNPLSGNLWLLVLIVTGISPWLVLKIKSLK